MTTRRRPGSPVSGATRRHGLTLWTTPRWWCQTCWFHLNGWLPNRWGQTPTPCPADPCPCHLCDPAGYRRARARSMEWRITAAEVARAPQEHAGAYGALGRWIRDADADQRQHVRAALEALIGSPDDGAQDVAALLGRYPHGVPFSVTITVPGA